MGEAGNSQKWYGPLGLSVPVSEMDVVAGGTRKINMEMKSPERTMLVWFTGFFKEVSAPHRLVYTEVMCDPDGNVISPKDKGMPEGTPDLTAVTVELQQDGDKTIMTMTHAGVPAGPRVKVAGCRPLTSWVRCSRSPEPHPAEVVHQTALG